MGKIFLLCLLFCVPSLWSCGKNNEPESISHGNYELVWSDEFNYSGLPDSKKWSYDTD